MRSNALIGLIVLVLIIVGVALWVLMGDPLMNGTATTTPQQTEEEEVPPQSGPITPAELEGRVVIDAPKSGANVPKDFTVTGKAPGPWYFEASFPIQVKSATGTVIATGIATALTEWMTPEDVAFKADISVESYAGPATLVLIRDNASGLPEHDASVEIPITIQ